MSVVSDSVWPHRRFLCPRDSPGRNTGVGCHCLLQCMKAKSESEVAQSCPTLREPWPIAHQAPPSMGFSRQEHWSGVPLPSPITEPYLWTFGLGLVLQFIDSVTGGGCSNWKQLSFLGEGKGNVFSIDVPKKKEKWHSSILSLSSLNV